MQCQYLMQCAARCVNILCMLKQFCQMYLCALFLLKHCVSQWILRRLHAALWSHSTPLENTIFMMHGVVHALCIKNTVTYCHYIIILIILVIITIIIIMLHINMIITIKRCHYNHNDDLNTAAKYMGLSLCMLQGQLQCSSLTWPIPNENCD